MINGKNISIGSIIWRVLRNPLCSDLSYEQAAEFALEFIRLIGAPLSMEDKVTNPPLELKDYKTYLPQNIIDIRGIRYLGIDGCSDPIAMRYATDIYHKSHDRDISGCSTEFTYVVQNCVLTTSIEKGFVEISYHAISTDDKGFPMIPDNESYKMGLEYYILYRYLEPLWGMGKITDKLFNHIDREKCWFLGQASSSMIIQGTDHLESIMNGLNRLIIQSQSHETFYKHFGRKEYLRKFN